MSQSSATYTDRDFVSAMAMIPGLNRHTGDMLIQRCAGEREFFEADDAFVRNITGVHNRHLGAEARKKYLEQGMRERVWTDDNHIGRLYFRHDEYPKRLAECGDAPVMLYKLGKCDLDAAHVVAVVGTRHADSYGIEFTRRMIADLAAKVDDLVIVSGLAYGIDVAAHKAALDNDVRTVAVTAHPLNTVYPAEHRGVASRIISRGGAMVTEYATCMPVHRGNFLARNRIIAAMSDVTVVVQSAEKGGAMSTARMAAAYDREVMAVPGRVTDRLSEGTNRLIASNRAQLLTCADDLIDMMRWPRKPTEGTQRELFVDLSPDMRRVVDLIREHPELTVNDLCARLDKGYSELVDILFQLEMNNVIVSIPGNRYAYVEM